jgi:predicted DsbA family dithiol-disulfide isomerase
MSDIEKLDEQIKPDLWFVEDYLKKALNRFETEGRYWIEEAIKELKPDLINRLMAENKEIKADKKRQAQNLDAEIERLNKEMQTKCNGCIFPEYIKKLEADLAAANENIEKRDEIIKWILKEVERILGPDFKETMEKKDEKKE